MIQSHGDLSTKKTIDALFGIKREPVYACPGPDSSPPRHSDYSIAVVEAKALELAALAAMEATNVRAIRHLDAGNQKYLD